MKFPEKRGDRDEFRRRIGNSFILSFGTGSGHGWLFLGNPGDEIMSKIDEEPTCRAAVRRVASPIGVTERSEKDRGCAGIV